jgi:hypothetical protein
MLCVQIQGCIPGIQRGVCWCTPTHSCHTKHCTDYGGGRVQADVLL